jgi:hypothetical protein
MLPFSRRSRVGGNPANQKNPATRGQNSKASWIKPLDFRLRGNDGVREY